MKLIIEDDEGRKTVVPFQRDEITIGRQEGNTIRLTERNVSRRHCRLVRHQGSILVEDLDSYTGVRVNGDRIEGRAAIRPGDLIEIGDYDLAVEGDFIAASPNGTAVTDPTLNLATAPTMQLHVPELAEEAPAPGEEPKATNADEPTAIIATPPAPTPEPRAKEIPRTEAPRLVALTTEHAGREFVLTRSPLVLGRSPDDDVLVDHRSISKGHCQLVREANGTWSVGDLRSATGVKVNGKKVSGDTLRPGDILQLGHVRLRFVGPGEVFSFIDSNTGRHELPARRGSGKLLVLGGISLAAVGGLIAYSQGVFAPGDALPAAHEDVAPTPEPGIAEAPSTGTTAIERAKAAVQKKDWAAVKSAARSAITDGAVEEGERLLETAEAELRAQAALSTASRATNEGDGEKALAQLLLIPEASVYADEAEALRPRAASVLVKAKVVEARALARKRQHEKAVEVLDGALVLAPGAKALETTRAELVRHLKSSKPVPAPRVRPARAAASARATEKSREGDDDAALEQRREQARKDFEQGVKLASASQFKQAITFFRRALKNNPSLADAHKYLGSCYAQVGDGENGARHYQKFLDLQPTHPQAAQIRKFLEDYRASKGE